jgi:hypothetical protein
MTHDNILYEEKIDFSPIDRFKIEETDNGDIAVKPENTRFANSIVSKTLPALVGYVQTLTAPVGYIYGLKRRDMTSVANPDYPATPITPTSPDTPEDIVIIRKPIETVERTVAVSTTNEVEQDILAMFGDDFNDKKIRVTNISHKEVESDAVAKYFLEYGAWNMYKTINDDFMNWLSTEATLKGTATIDDSSQIWNLLGVLGELQEALYKSTGKSSSTWAIVSPRVAFFLSHWVGTNTNGSFTMDNGRTLPSNEINPYVMTINNCDIYTWDTKKDVTGGDGVTTEADGFIYMGLSGGPNTASVYYTPYNEYIIKGGSDAYTGQSTVFYKVRDAWETNPLDSYDKSLTDITNPRPADNTSQYIVKADIVFNYSLLA